MTRILGAALAAAGDLATSFGLGGNGLADELPHEPGSFGLLDAAETEIGLGDQPLTEIETEDGDEVDIELGDEAETGIELDDEPETEISLGDGG